MKNIKKNIRERLVYLTLKKINKIIIPCDVAHQIRELLEKNIQKGTTWGYIIEDVEE